MGQSEWYWGTPMTMEPTQDEARGQVQEKTVNHMLIHLAKGRMKKRLLHDDQEVQHGHHKAEAERPDQTKSQVLFG